MVSHCTYLASAEGNLPAWLKVIGCRPWSRCAIAAVRRAHRAMADAEVTSYLRQRIQAEITQQYGLAGGRPHRYRTGADCRQGESSDIAALAGWLIGESRESSSVDAKLLPSGLKADYCA